MKKNIMKFLWLLLLLFCLVSCKNEENMNDKSSKDNVVGDQNVEIFSDDEADSIVEELEDVKDDPELAFEKGGYYKVTCPVLNIRKTPSLEGEVIGSLNENDLIELEDVVSDDQGGIWLKEKNQQGWFYSDFCERVEIVAETERDFIRIRTKEATSLYSSIESQKTLGNLLANDTVYTVLGEPVIKNNQTWYKIISYEGEVGWVDGRYADVYLIDDSMSISPRERVVMILEDSTLDYFDDLEKALLEIPRSMIIKQDGLYNDVFSLIIEGHVYTIKNGYSRNSYAIAMESEYFRPIVCGLDDYLLYKDCSENIYVLHNLQTDISHGITIKGLKEISELIVYSDLNQTRALINHTVDGKGCISYLNLETLTLTPFKKPVMVYDWVLERGDTGFSVYRRNTETGEKVAFLNLNEYFFSFDIQEDNSYLLISEIDEVLDLPLEDYSAASIEDHVMKIMDCSYSIDVSKLNSVDEKYLYFSVNEHITSHIVFMISESYLVKWEKGTNNYQVVERLELPTYLDAMTYPISQKDAKTYLEQGYLNSYDEFEIEVERDDFYIIRMMVPTLDIKQDRLILWDVKNQKKSIVLEHAVSDILFIVDDRYMVTMTADYDFSIYDLNEEGRVIYHSYSNDFDRIAKSDWLITGTNSGDSIVFVNIKTGEERIFLEADDVYDYVYVLSDDDDVLTIYKKLKSNRLHEGEQTEISVLDFKNERDIELLIEVIQSLEIKEKK